MEFRRLLFRSIRQDVDQTFARINDIGRSLSSLNSILRRTADGTSQNAGLEDDRDRLLQELAGLVKIDAEIRPDGTVNVRLDNSNGPLLVDQMGPKLLGAAEANGQIQLTLDPFGHSGLVSVPASGAPARLADASVLPSDTPTPLHPLATHS